MLQLPKWMLRIHRLRTDSSFWFHSPFEGRSAEIQEIGAPQSLRFRPRAKKAEWNQNKEPVLRLQLFLAPFFLGFIDFWRKLAGNKTSGGMGP